MQHRFFSLLALATLLFVGCNQTENEEPTPQKEAKLTLTSGNPLEFTAVGGEGAITFKIENPIENAQVEANSANSWVTISATAEGRIAFTVAANTLEEPRETTLTLTYDKKDYPTTIKQEAYKNPEEGEEGEEGEEDPDKPQPPVVEDLTYIDAMAIYYGTNKQGGFSTFQIQLSTKSLVSIDLPLHYCFLQLNANPVTDIENLKLEAGEYTLLTSQQESPMTFYPTTDMGDGYGGSMIYELTQTQEEVIGAIVDGKVTIETVGEGYLIFGNLKLANNREINFSYSGGVIVRDQSGENQTPADEVEIPISTLTHDVVFKPSPRECYYALYPSYFQDYPNFDFVMIQLCKDNTYKESLMISLLIDRTKFPEDRIPAGKYFVMNRSEQEWQSVSLATLESFRISTDVDPYIEIGSMYQTDYTTFHSLIGGEVEVKSFNPESEEIDMTWALKTNGEKQVTVSGSYKGKLVDLY